MGTGAEVAIATALISAGTTAVTADMARQQKKRQFREKQKLDKQARIDQVAAEDADKQSATNQRAIEDAAADRIRANQATTQGIDSNFGNVDVGALGATSSNTAASTLNPALPRTEIR